MAPYRTLGGARRAAARRRGPAARLAALGHPVRLRLLLAVLRGATGTAELAEVPGIGTSGRIYHHTRTLTAAGWPTAGYLALGALVVAAAARSSWWLAHTAHSCTASYWRSPYSAASCPNPSGPSRTGPASARTRRSSAASRSVDVAIRPSSSRASAGSSAESRNIRRTSSLRTLPCPGGAKSQLRSSARPASVTAYVRLPRAPSCVTSMRSLSASRASSG